MPLALLHSCILFLYFLSCRPFSSLYALTPSSTNLSCNCNPQRIAYFNNLQPPHSLLERGRKASSPEGKKRPDWLSDLLRCGFFGSCNRHCEMPRSEQRLYCMDCNLAICKHCAADDHGHHPRLHIVKYKCDNAVRVQDMRSYFNCSEIKSYIINEDKVVLISPRSPSETSEQPKNCRSCAACGVSIQRSSDTFCSIACKASFKPTDQQEKAINEGSRKESSTITLHSGKEESCSSPDNARNARGDEPRRSFRPRHRLLKRKGIPHRAPFF